MFALYSVLHYCPIGATDDVEYTATVMEEGIWQIEGGGNHTIFPTLEEWLQSLPGSPDPSMLAVTATLAEEHKRKEKQRIEKVKRDKKKWNVPLRNMPRSLLWTRHIYSMIRECDRTLLQRDDMRDAFNHLVQTLLDHNDVIRTSVPYPRKRYTSGIRLESDFDAYDGIRDYVHILPHTDRAHYRDTLRIIYAAYEPLYALLHDTVVPFMERTYKDKCNRRDMIIYQRTRDKYVAKMIKLTAKYEQEADHLRSQMERYQSYMDRITS